MSTVSVILISTSSDRLTSERSARFRRRRQNPRLSTHFERSMMVAAKANWFSLSVNSREEAGLGLGLAPLLLRGGHSVTAGNPGRIRGGLQVGRAKTIADHAALRGLQQFVMDVCRRRGFPRSASNVGDFGQERESSSRGIVPISDEVPRIFQGRRNGTTIHHAHSRNLVAACFPFPLCIHPDVFPVATNTVTCS
ncbi:hypothetical protein PMI31_05858 [Pseudomonas sp. GM55]|nr:hypothetical protein PMI31_05858 [Pseudomonas sp. GM55]